MLDYICKFSAIKPDGANIIVASVERFLQLKSHFTMISARYLWNVGGGDRDELLERRCTIHELSSHSLSRKSTAGQSKRYSRPAAGASTDEHEETSSSGASDAEEAEEAARARRRQLNWLYQRRRALNLPNRSSVQNNHDLQHRRRNVVARSSIY